jgi:long-chain fatty acid transport protein
MVYGFLKFSALALFGATALTGAASAGGFSRGEANTDILYEDATVNLDATYVFVNPQRKFATLNGAAATDGVFSGSYFIPNLAVKGTASDVFSCALTYTETFGADATYGKQARDLDQAEDAAANGAPTSLGNYTLSKKLLTEEYGATCGIKVDAGKGRFHVLGGVYMQTLDYVNFQNYGTLKLRDNSALGYRLGVAYDIPEIALRADLMYRSGVTHDPTGTFLVSSAGATALGLLGSTASAGDILTATGFGRTPQSVKMSLQSGVAPGWLVYGSVKWTDWSVLDNLKTNISKIGDKFDNFNYKDGWTIQAGIGHQFTDDISGTVNLTWDQGVGTGADISTDTWTLGAGTRIKAGPGNFEFGGAVSYLTAGSQSKSTSANYNATANGDWAYAVSAGYNVKF